MLNLIDNRGKIIVSLGKKTMNNDQDKQTYDLLGVA